MTYVLDTNFITAILKNNEHAIEKLKSEIMNGSELYVNCISYYEIKRGLLACGATSKISRFDQFCRKFKLLFLDTVSILEKASTYYAYLKPIGQLLEDADLLIASITEVNNCILVTDDDDFDRLSGLKTENWLL